MRTVDPISATAPRELVESLPDIRAALEEQQRFRLDQLDELAEAMANAPPWARSDAHHQVSDMLRESAAMALAEVEDALARLRAGRYGICERCASPISLERLEILPMSRYCMRCQHCIDIGSG
jgi:RNA polymerase-binding transcription factor DksA